MQDSLTLFFQLRVLTALISSVSFSPLPTGGRCIVSVSTLFVAFSALDVPEELLPDPEGILMGGGRCFTPFPKTDDWTSGEIPSPCAGQMWFSQISDKKARQNILTFFFFSMSMPKWLGQTNPRAEWRSRPCWLNKVQPPPQGDSPHLYWGTGALVQRCLSCGTSWPDTLHLSRTHLCTD